MALSQASAPASQPTALPIHIKALTKRYGAFYALDSVDLDINSGEFLTLLGPSGSGKTTLLMAIAGFNRPDAGSIKFGDEEVILTPPHKRNVGMVFQSYALFPHMSVAQNVGFPLKLRGINGNALDERVSTALATVQLDDLGDRRIEQLSGGQRQRVALARAFVFRPRILLMDEPLSALDKKLREQMQIELKHLHRQLGVTTVYVTHDQREALTMSDRIAVINHGKLIQVDEPRTLYNRPSNHFVADFIGESSVLPVARGDHGNLMFEDQIISTHSTNDAMSLVIRPERLSITSDSKTSNENTIVFSGTVDDFVYQGETAYAIMTTRSQQRIAFRFGTDAAFQETTVQPGQTIKLALKRDDVIVIPRDRNT